MANFFYKSMSVFICPLLFSCFAAIFSASLSEATNNGGITVDLIHRDFPLSPLYDPSKTRLERLTSSFNRSFSRLRFLNLASTSSQFESPLSPVQGEYLMKISIGTPPVDVVAIADTGSDLTWIQCTPCPDCYKQSAPLFDPHRSRTYRNLTCSSLQCSDVRESCDDRDDPNAVCKYQVTYGDNSVTNGDLAVETFGFDSSATGHTVSFPEVAFGCGHDDYGNFFNQTSGIIGLGIGNVSIIRQLASSINNTFSYCLTSPESNVSSKIHFGNKAAVTGQNVVSTPLISGDYVTFYLVTLEGFSVGNKKFGFHEKTDVKEIEEGNMILDTGTTFTFLQGPFYNQLEALLVKAVNGSRVSDPRRVGGLCYRLPSGGEFRAPPVTAHFRGADVVLQQESLFVEAAEGVVCLSLVATDTELMIFGNINQMNYMVGIDLENEKVNFLPTDCSKK